MSYGNLTESEINELRECCKLFKASDTQCPYYLRYLELNAKANAWVNIQSTLHASDQRFDSRQQIHRQTVRCLVHRAINISRSMTLWGADAVQKSERRAYLQSATLAAIWTR